MKFQTIKNSIGRHYIFLLYAFMAFCLLIGLLQGFDKRYSAYVVGLYILPFSGLYLLGHILVKKYRLAESKILYNTYIQRIRRAMTPFWLANFCLLITLTTFILHGIILDEFPGFRAIREFNYHRLYDYRKSVTNDIPTWFAYLNSFTVKAFIPFAIVYTAVKGLRLQFWSMCFLAFIIGLNAMQKSHFMTFFLPLAILLLYKKKFIASILTFSFVGLSVFMMVFITNPPLKYSAVSQFVDPGFTLGDFTEEEDEPQNFEEIDIGQANQAAVNSIFLRTIYLPGEMVGKWFDAIPEEKPFLKGKGYRFYAKLTGKNFHDYSLEMYPIIYPEYAERGYTGSVNVASFMYDYANWGLFGLPLCAFITAALLLSVNTVFGPQTGLKLAFNTMPVLMLSSVNYTTLLLSGGWGLLILLYVIFLKKGSDEING